jgi:hypothetical protein
MRPSPEEPGFLNIGCGPFRAPAPWWNIDVVITEHPEYPTQPDEVVPRDRSVVELFGPASCRRIYMGHLLEHVPWEAVPSFLALRVAPALVDDGELAIVGPDVYRAIDMWHKGQLEWFWVPAGLEDCDAQFDLQEKGVSYSKDEVTVFLKNENAEEGWPEATHKWNQYEQRLERVVKLALPEPEWDVRAVPISEEYLNAYPVVAYTQFQCAVIATRRT